MASTQHVVVMVSGRGRNLQALIDARAQGKLGPCRMTVISNRASAQALERARQAGLPTEVISHRAFDSREAFDTELARRIDALNPDLLVLAGFMRVLGEAFVSRFHGRMINIHPSLLPRHKGLNTHQRALEAGDREHGASVHFVTAALDGGAVIIQGRVSVEPQDTPEQLSDRVMSAVEVRILPQAVSWLLGKEIRLVDEAVVFCDKPLDSPLTLAHLTEPFR